LDWNPRDSTWTATKLSKPSDFDSIPLLLLCVQEMQQCRRGNLRSEEEILKRHALERRRFPQLLKQERKTRLMIFKESLRIGQVSTTPEQDREKIKQVSDLGLKNLGSSLKSA